MEEKNEVYILAKGDSMLPTLVEGKIYKVEPVAEGGVYPNDIIVFKKNGRLICHRVKRIIQTRNGQFFIETKGDNCPMPDPFTVTFNTIVGKILEYGG